MSRPLRVFDQLVLAALLVAFWQLASMKLGANALPPPAETIRRVFELCRTAEFWGHVGETARAVAIAGAIVSAGGAVLGLALGLDRFAGEVASPILVAVYALPKVVLYPLVLLLFGISLSAKVALGVVNGFAPVAIIAMEAVRQISPTLLRTARVLHLSKTDMIFRVLLPATLPEILNGVRIGLALTIVGVLIGEIFASNRGLGFMLTTANQLNDNVLVMALTVFIVLAALLVSWAIAGLAALTSHRAVSTR